MFETRNDGHWTEVRVSRSSPSASIPFHSSSKFADTVISRDRERAFAAFDPEASGALRVVARHAR